MLTMLYLLLTLNVGPVVPVVNMTTITNAQFEEQYDKLMTSFKCNFTTQVRELMYGIPGRVPVANSKIQYLYILALQNDINKSYLTDMQILKMLSYDG